MISRTALTGILVLMVSCKGNAKPAPPSVAANDVKTYDTEAGKPMTAMEALKSMKLPDNFTATLFAAEPAVRQPIDMKVDASGRVWVAESYSYMSGSTPGEDRITVLTDTDGNGMADRRTVFASGLNRLMSIEIGFGGVWVLAPPLLLFYPDADGDLKPDGPAVRHMTNWSTHGEWNMTNGLVFGPDGWLYGRQGQMGASSPTTAKGVTSERLSGAIWRYHPPSGKFEIVAQGMTNPWGLDWNVDGELFASGNCNGHLWHIVGGSLYEWGFGARQFSSEYGRTPPIEIAPHYAPGKDWWESWRERFEKADANNRYGGGHSHSGLLICNGSAWPEAMRGHTLMSNIHGHRINEDTIEAKESGYLSRRVGDPILPADSWFKAVSLVAAADGAFFISDWSDTGECHDQDGIHQNSGRIFRVVPGKTVKPPRIDGADDATLVSLLTGDAEEPARQALKLLQFRGLGKKLAPEATTKLGGLLANPDFTVRMRALSALHGSGLLDDAQLLAATLDGDERLRTMAVRYWAERPNGAATGDRFLEMAKGEASPRVLLHLASVTRLLPAQLARALTTALIARAAPPLDARTAQLLWHVQIQKPQFTTSDAEALIAACESADFAEYLAQYLVEHEGDQGLTTIFKIAASREKSATILTAAIEMARKQKGFMTAPQQWPEWRKKWLNSPDNSLRAAALSASILFGDREALDGLAVQITSPKTSLADKTAALETLAAAQAPESTAIVSQAFRNKELRVPAIHALRHFKQPAIAASLIGNWSGYDEAERRAVIDTLVTRKEWAMSLLEAMEPDGIPATALSAAQARNLAESGDPALTEAVLKHWGTPSRSTPQKDAALARATRLLADPKMPGDPAKGRVLFSQSCGTCHTLYAEGGKLGPDLTGRNRADLPSLLRSIVDPSAEVAEDGRLTIATLTDGTIVSGIVTAKDAAGMTILSQQGEIPLKTAAIAHLQIQTTSPMPEGLLDGLTDPQLADLLAYIRADQKASSK